jgi:hypothetical protein
MTHAGVSPRIHDRMNPAEPADTKLATTAPQQLHQECGRTEQALDRKLVQHQSHSTSLPTWGRCACRVQCCSGPSADTVATNDIGKSGAALWSAQPAPLCSTACCTTLPVVEPSTLLTTKSQMHISTPSNTFWKLLHRYTAKVQRQLTTEGEASTILERLLPFEYVIDLHDCPPCITQAGQNHRPFLLPKGQSHILARIQSHAQRPTAHSHKV